MLQQLVQCARAKGLLATHLQARPEADALRAALDGSLRKKWELVEQKRRQVVQFMDLQEGGVEAARRGNYEP